MLRRIPQFIATSIIKGWGRYKAFDLVFGCKDTLFRDQLSVAFLA